MNPMKRLGLTVFVLILAALFAASPALAGKNADAVASSTTTFRLVPPADAPEPDASGKCILEDPDPYEWWGYTDVRVSCKSLTPARSYVVVCLVWWEVWQYLDMGSSSGWYCVADGLDFDEYGVDADGKGRLDAQFTLDDYGCSVRRVEDLWIVNSAGDVVLER